MSAREKRRGRGLWSALVSDPYRKLAAIGLGIGLWYFLDSQVMQEQQLTVTLVAQDQDSITLAQKQDRSLKLVVMVPTGLVTVRGYRNPITGKPIQTVDLNFEGPKHLIEDLRATTPSFTAGPFQNLQWKQIDGFSFDVEEIYLADRTLRPLKVTMDPLRVDVLLEQNNVQEITLSHDKVEFLFHSSRDDERYRPRLREKTAAFADNRVSVRGPASELEHFLSRARPFKAVLSPSQNGREASGLLQLNTDDPALDLVLETKTKVTVGLIPQQIPYTMEVPVLLDDLSLPPELRDKYVPNEPVKTIRIKVSGPVHARLVGFEEWPHAQRLQWARDNLRLVVWIPPPEENGVVNNVLQARLELVGSLAGEDPIHCSLASEVAVQLKAQ